MNDAAGNGKSMRTLSFRHVSSSNPTTPLRYDLGAVPICVVLPDRCDANGVDETARRTDVLPDPSFSFRWPGLPARSIENRMTFVYM